MTLETEVLVVGGGPVGLTLAADLAWRGRRAVLVETRAEPTDHPKATLLGARSMEIFRRWGLDDAIFARALPPDVAYAILFCTRLAAPELHRFSSPSINEVRNRPPGAEDRWRELRWSPYGKTQIGQQALEPILIDFAAAQDGLELRRGWTHVGFEDRGDHVLSTLRDNATGRLETVRSRYLVGCDGGASGVRKALGVRFGGRGAWRSNVSFFFRAPRFLEAHGKGLGNLYFVFAPDAFGVFTAIDGETLWNYQLYFLDPSQETKDVDAAAALTRAVGKPFEFELLGVSHWRHHQSVAPRWRIGNVFLAGDAAHLFAPTGGVGMNTGIADAADLSWKLDAALSGWGGEILLESYEAERRPVAWRNSQRSMTNSDTIDFVMAQVSAVVEEQTPAGAAARSRLVEDIHWMARQFHSAGAHLGHRYVASPVIEPDGAPEPPDDFAQVTQSTWPGCRAPHVWRGRGRSTLDWYGQGFVVVSSHPGFNAAPMQTAEAERLAEAVRAEGAAARVETVHDAAIAAAYERPLVLVRPDGHVAWRGVTAPADASALARRVCGRD